ncbi:hypothetical protein BIY22_12915 [Vibrio panuliri]|uniref:Glycosyltransferase RgtA/B/C/D-like domain-containing protein n=1 Tax=Vibrio panuliri TaxID=1381081 RepID=A0A1Q9HAI9_9VIBR|nr:hypothetical protein [Vibrio panuliri]OLQ86145.1 hypothetical protein BIY22_12915 [Vibrio panuliri]
MSERRVLGLLLLLCFFCNILALANYQGIYWDDWTLVSQHDDTILKTFVNAAGYGGFITSHIHINMLEYGGVLSYRIALVILSVFNVFFIYKILSRVHFFSLVDIFCISVIYVSVPYFESDLMLINFPYVFFYSIFLLSFYLYVINNSRSKLVNILVLALFLVSFLINSLVPFYGVFIIYLFYECYFVELDVKKAIVSLLKTKYIYLMLPLVFAVVKFRYFVPSEQYANYNEISLNGMSFYELAVDMLRFLHGSIAVLIFEVLHVISELWWVIIPLCALLTNKMKGVSFKFELPNKRLVLLIGFGLGVFFLGAFPYLLVGKPPVIDGVESRFQLLLPLGFAIFVYFSILFLLKKCSSSVVIFALSFLSISLFLVKFEAYVKYEIDWLYQQSIMASFENSDEIKNNNTFSYTIDSSDNIRRLRFYELNGYSKRIFGRDDKLFAYKVDKSEIYKYGQYKEYEEFNFSSWKESVPLQMTILDVGYKEIGDGFFERLHYVLTMKWLSQTDEKKFQQQVSSLVEIKFKPW